MHMFAALQHAAFRRLFAAHVVALLGTGLATIAIGFLAVDVAGGDAAGVLGTLLALKMLTFLVIGPLAPAIARRVGTKRLLVATDLGRAGVALALPFVDDVVTAFVLVIVLQSAAALFTPTFQAAIPTVVRDERQYTGALALSRLAYDLEALASPTLASLILVVAPSVALFGGTAAGFLASGLLILSVALPKPAAPAAGEPSRRSRLTRGIRLMVELPRLRGALAMHLALAAVGAVPMVLTVPLVRTGLGGDEGQAAGLLAAFGVGSMLAALAMTTVVDRIGPRRYMIVGLGLEVLAVAAVWPVLTLAPGTGALPWLWVVWGLAGMGNAAVLAPMGRVVRDAVDDADLPDVFAAQFSLAHGWWLLTYPLAGWGATLLGFGPTALALALLGAAVLAVAVRMWAVRDRVPVG